MIQLIFFFILCVSMPGRDLDLSFTEFHNFFSSNKMNNEVEQWTQF